MCNINTIFKKVLIQTLAGDSNRLKVLTEAKAVWSETGRSVLINHLDLCQEKGRYKQK